MHLTVHEQRIDYLAAIIDGDVFHDLYFAGISVDLDDTDVCAKRKSEILWFEKVRRRQPWFSVGWNFLGDVRGERNLLNGQAGATTRLRLWQSAGRCFTDRHDGLRRSGRSGTGCFARISSGLESDLRGIALHHVRGNLSRLLS